MCLGEVGFGRRVAVKASARTYSPLFCIHRPPTHSSTLYASKVGINVFCLLNYLFKCQQNFAHHCIALDMRTFLEHPVCKELWSKSFVWAIHFVIIYTHFVIKCLSNDDKICQNNDNCAEMKCVTQKLYFGHDFFKGLQKNISRNLWVLAYSRAMQWAKTFLSEQTF